jgi:hypothetical protein
VNIGEAGPPASSPAGFERRLEAELVKVVAERRAARPATIPAGRPAPARPAPARPRAAWVPPGHTERAAARLLRSPGLARALVTTPSLLLPWLIATTVILAAGAVATLGTGQPLVALLAPAVAASGIAYAYGPGIDPAWELSRSMAVSDRLVLLVRALAVFALDAALGLAASLASGVAAGITFGWLVPMTALCALALATSTVTRSANAGMAVGLGGWAITILSARVADGRLTAAVSDPALIAPYLAFAACCAAVAMYATRIPRGA